MQKKETMLGKCVIQYFTQFIEPTEKRQKIDMNIESFIWNFSFFHDSIVCNVCSPLFFVCSTFDSAIKSIFVIFSFKNLQIGIHISK